MRAASGKTRLVGVGAVDRWIYWRSNTGTRVSSPSHLYDVGKQLLRREFRSGVMRGAASVPDLKWKEKEGGEDGEVGRPRAGVIKICLVYLLKQLHVCVDQE
ncbi:hypothetical protein TNCT_727901 [Trichonephila clavata]|uniref:Uncharacterized protein n=1 Tax=Trichonephila clavata TaxID=2740835 RepID=A0A8X6GS41_TRICU|nr:hypothetical protein TNCT_727901 [Trichonephila clavata]